MSIVPEPQNGDCDWLVFEEDQPEEPPSTGEYWHPPPIEVPVFEPQDPNSHMCTVCNSGVQVAVVRPVLIGPKGPMPLGLCEPCLASSWSWFAGCPICGQLHKEHNHSGGNGNMYPCPKCIITKTDKFGVKYAAAKCSVCKISGPYKHMQLTSRGFMLCMSCIKSSVACSAPYCKSRTHPGIPGTVTTLGESRTYCHDCSDARTQPEEAPNDYHPLSWDYHPECWCAVCVYLSGRSSRWEPAKRPPPDVTCFECDTEIFSGTATAVDEDIYCHCCRIKHLTKCPKCDRWRRQDAFQPAYNKSIQSWCHECIEATGKYWFCKARCMAWVQGPGPGRCPCGGIHDYQYSPVFFPRFLAPEERKHTNTPYMGLELEVEVGEGQKITRTAGVLISRRIADEFSYIVHDGTLRGTRSNGRGGQFGFEIVTYPFTWAWFNREWGRIEHLLQSLSAAGFRSWEGKRCGIHIHLSRDSMSVAHRARFIRFIYGHWPLSLCVGQRTHADAALEKYAPFDKEPLNRLFQKWRFLKNPGISGNKHYCALSTNQNRTVEARWFRGTLNPLGLRKNVEFIHSVWEFTRDWGLTSSNEYNYITWLMAQPQRRKYAVLADYLEKNYVTRR